MDLFAFFCYDVLLLSCFLTGCLFVRKRWRLEYKLLVVLSGLTLLVEGVSQISTFLKAQLQWPYNLFCPAETVLIGYIFYRASTHRVVKRMLAVLLILLPMGIVVFHSLHPVFFKINESANLFCLFLELMSSFLFLIDAFLDNSNASLTGRPLFWLTCGLIIYCSSFILMHALISYMTLPKISRNYYILNGFIANMFMYAGFLACYISLRPAKIRKEPGQQLA